MNDSPKTGRNSSNRKIKAQLDKELAEANAILKEQETELVTCNKELQQAQDEIKRLNKLEAQLKLAEEELKQVRNVEEENEKLKKQIQKTEENAAKQIEEEHKKFHESERKYQQLKRETQELDEKLAEHENKLARGKKEIPTDISASKAKFLVHLYPRQPHQEHYQGKIEHPLTRDKEVCCSHEPESIYKFILRHLPQLAEEEKIEEKEISRKRRKRLSMPFKTETPKKKDVLKEIRFQQLNRVVEPGHPLRANQSFTLYTRLHFPVMPTAHNMNIDTSAYELQVIVKDADDKNIIARKGTADMLSLGVVDYEPKIKMSSLFAGKYLLKIYTIAPFAQISESERYEVIVG